MTSEGKCVKEEFSSNMAFPVEEEFSIKAAFVEERGTLDKKKVVEGGFSGKGGFFGKARFSYRGVPNKKNL